MGKTAGRKRKAASKKAVTLPQFTGDHGTGTAAAMAQTFLEPMKNDDGKPDPNKRARRRRIEVIDHLTSLSLRQYQAAREIRDAYCQCEKLSSGSPLKEQVDSSARPDATMAIQVDAMSRLRRAMKMVPNHMRPIVEAVCWHNTQIKDLPVTRGVAISTLQGAMTCVANHLRY
ncbi:hypothetical protein P6F26_16760 [Roseibacterium sp. SDUM158017]|uniref:hypothetical protein n=1 Tax=Roseicyclus salinarum TaxID=3036773 RepID=UPI0024155266|nr:hypothetical protein [Roseibacterium sp. SDUM158017]MDG4650101.1 hypothetical protein [Roseibacterium sp. SDUM158017]